MTRQTVTIPAADHAATAETRPVRLLRALAQNPEPLSAPALASLLAEPGRRRRLLSAYDHALRLHEQAGHVERAGRERKGRGRPAIIWRITTAGRGWLDDHDKAPALAAAAAAEASQARRAAAERDQALDEARATFTLQTPRISRKRAAHQLRELGCTLDQIGAVFHVTKERIRQDLLWDPAARKPPRKPKPRTRLSQTQLLLGLSTSGSPESRGTRPSTGRYWGAEKRGHLGPLCCWTRATGPWPPWSGDQGNQGTKTSFPRTWPLWLTR